MRVYVFLSTLLYDFSKIAKKFLSTLSLRRATANAVDQILPGHISIHALLAESDRPSIAGYLFGAIFLSTLSLRRATDQGANNQTAQQISIHALLAESDGKPTKLAGRKLVFLSTLSLRRATTYLSILFQKILNFYPRSPCGERRLTSFAG